MENRNARIELLAPAGSPGSLQAAVASGADAVYLGLAGFNARLGAENFGRENLRDHIENCHIRGVRVYLALNTLLYDDEIPEAFDTACFAYENGIDAVIVQDMGLASLMSEQLPDLPLHASTQCSITGLEGARYMGSAGFSRVVLAREASPDEIRRTTASGIDVEVFVHGARCYSYSGQCLMSSMLGGRSGNRGACAQPCRLPYELTDSQDRVLLKGHALSLKDISYIDFLDELKDMGVRSLKIEGRMKNPGYVAAVVGIYRKYLDMGGKPAIAKADRNDLLKAFNRDGFSSGIFSSQPRSSAFSLSSPSNSGAPVGKVIETQKDGASVVFNEEIDKSDGLRIGAEGSYAGRNFQPGIPSFINIDGKPGDIVFRTRDIAFDKKYSLPEVMARGKKLPVHIMASVRIDEKPRIEIRDENGNVSTVVSSCKAQAAVSNGTSSDRITEQLLKTGNTPYKVESAGLECDEGVFVRISEINELRRKALAGLDDIRKGSPREAGCEPPRTLSDHKKDDPRPSIGLCLYKLPLGLDVSRTKAARIYADASIGTKNLELLGARCRESGLEFFIHLPFHMETPPSVGCDGYMVENHGQLRFAKNQKTALGSGFNICNSYSAAFYDGFLIISVSPEMNAARIRGMIHPPAGNLEITVYGRLQVMESPYCPASDVCKGDLCLKTDLSLSDRKGEKWPMLCDPVSHNARIFNPHRILLAEETPKLLESGIGMLRVNIFDETAEEVYEITSACLEGRRPSLNPGYKFTRGHY
ncbi:MAG: U32 family peptidase [Clostridia bacterium]|nr:U32 family peptidase [Clostridia bacterium]